MGRSPRFASATHARDTLTDGLDLTRIPTHVACVMDGNGRWATKRGLKRTDGHAAGEEALFDTVEGALDLGRAVAHRLRVLDRELAAARSTRSAS